MTRTSKTSRKAPAKGSTSRTASRQAGKTIRAAIGIYSRLLQLLCLSCILVDGHLSFQTCRRFFVNSRCLSQFRTHAHPTKEATSRKEHPRCQQKTTSPSSIGFSMKW